MFPLRIHRFLKNLLHLSIRNIHLATRLRMVRKKVLNNMLIKYLPPSLIIALGVPKRVKMFFLMNFITTLESLKGRETTSTQY